MPTSSPSRSVGKERESNKGTRGSLYEEDTKKRAKNAKELKNATINTPIRAAGTDRGSLYEKDVQERKEKAKHCKNIQIRIPDPEKPRGRRETRQSAQGRSARASSHSQSQSPQHRDSQRAQTFTASSSTSRTTYSAGGKLPSARSATFFQPRRTTAAPQQQYPPQFQYPPFQHSPFQHPQYSQPYHQQPQYQQQQRSRPQQQPQQPRNSHPTYKTEARQPFTSIPPPLPPPALNIGVPPEEDPYPVLGVARSATAREIKQAYKKRALALHPDKNPGNPKATGNMKKLNKAYNILSDSERRGRYDKHGTVIPDEI